jgi:hypothetical protein
MNELLLKGGWAGPLHAPSAFCNCQSNSSVPRCKSSSIGVVLCTEGLLASILMTGTCGKLSRSKEFSDIKIFYFEVPGRLLRSRIPRFRSGMDM